MNRCLLLLIVFYLCQTMNAQVYSPKLLRQGQPDSTDLKKFTQAICTEANAHTERERAEAIWRFFLTDGRFVKPGFWYHIAGWTYEEPSGEVLDPMKLLNSYGFGLCYHIAPLLEAVYQAAGFRSARCWFLTGHTVTEVFYDGHYHYFDSDMMGYNVSGEGPFRGKPVVSVRDLEQHPEIILRKLDGPKKVKPNTVDTPWYPADVRAGAMANLAELFSTSGDNYLYPYTRHSDGHSMDFELRRGETLTRFFGPEEPDLYYLPYQFDGKIWKEFPREISEYQIRTLDGPKSQKDQRSWATGRIDYRPPAVSSAVTIISMPSPYVIIDAQFKMNVRMPSGIVQVETSRDNGRTWSFAGKLEGAHHGDWTVEPHILVKTPHGRLTAVSGTYEYSVRITTDRMAAIDSLRLTSRVQVNPRALPFMVSGKNEFVYSAGAQSRREEIASPISKARLENMDQVDEGGQLILRPAPTGGTAFYVLSSNNGPLTGFDIGARFMELRDGLAPDKLTAETRHTAVKTALGEASIEWSTSMASPFQTLWKYNSNIPWLDGDTVRRLLKWPQTFQKVRQLPAGTRKVFIKLRSSGPAIDDIRMAVYSRGAPTSGIQISQRWRDTNGEHQHVESIADSEKERTYSILAADEVVNQSVSFSVK